MVIDKEFNNGSTPFVNVDNEAQYTAQMLCGQLSELIR